MPDPFPIADDLDSVLNDIWMRWTRGAADRRSPFHTPVVGSTGLSSGPGQRVMVLRKADRGTGTLRFHTDRRSGKVAQIEAGGPVSVIGYDSSAKIQVRVNGTAVLLTDGEVVDAAWASTSASGRRSYLTTLAPGCANPVPTSGLPVAFETNVPTLAESETGRRNFALVLVTLNRLEWLRLASTGHRRAAFSHDGADWTGRWLIP